MGSNSEYWDMIDKKREQSRKKGTRASGICQRVEKKNPRAQGVDARTIFADFIGFVPSNYATIMRKIRLLLNGIDEYMAIMEQAGEYEPMCLSAGLVADGKLTEKGKKMLERLNKKYGRSGE